MQNEKKETYYKLHTGNLWGREQKTKTIAERLGIAISSPDKQTQEREQVRYPSGHRLRTYQSDIASLMQEKQTSQVDIVIAAQKKGHKTESAEHKKMREGRREKIKTALVIACAILLIGSGASLFYIFFKKTVGEETLPTGQSGMALIFADREEKKVLETPDRRSFITLIEEIKKNTAETQKAVVETRFFEKEVLGETRITTKRLWGILAVRAPDSLQRSLDQTFAFGIHAAFQNTPFFVFKTTFFESAFAGMLDWEREMEPDIGPLFSATYSPVGGQPFEDSIVRNKDTRTVRDKSGAVVFFYAFPDREHLIITTNEKTFSELLPRLTR